VREAQEFAYHRSVAPMMWVLVAIASVELVVTHVLVGLFAGWWVAAVLSVLTLPSVIWLVSVIASMRRLPVTLDAERLVMRVGTLRLIVVPTASIAGLRREFDRAAVKDGATRNLALIAWPNVMVEVDPPLAGRRSIRWVAHRLDDPVAFAEAIDRLVAAR
jgi:hypothetical protein